MSLSGKVVLALGATTLGLASAQATEFTPYIIDGSPSNASQWPYMTAIVHKNQEAMSGQFCGGTLYKGRYVITAAHCVDNLSEDDIDLVVGINDLTKESSQGVRVGASKITVHSSYRASGWNYDIAVIELERTIPASQAQSVTLAEDGFNATLPLNTVLTVMGWGDQDPDPETATYPAQLHQVDVFMQSDEICHASSPNFASVGEDNFCAGRANVEGYDSCGGDSGGPIVFNDGSEIKQVGIVSWGSSQCGQQGTYGVYADISYFNDWIQENASGFYVERNVDLGYIEPGTVTQTFTFVNDSTQVVDMNTISTYEDGKASSSVFDDQCSAKTLNPGEQCIVSLKTEVSAIGSYVYQLSYDYNFGGMHNADNAWLAFEVRNKASDAVTQALAAMKGDAVFVNDVPWTTMKNGVRSAPALGFFEESEVVITGIPSGVVTFDLSTQSDYDTLDVYINGSLSESIVGSIDVPVTLKFVTFDNTLRLVYTRGLEYTEGDGASITNVKYSVLGSETSVSSSSSSGGGSLGFGALMALLVTLRRRYA